MSFGLPPSADEPRLTYGGYLKVPELCGLQQLLSDPPQHDELLFIIVHQTYELWFKQLLHEIDTIIGHLQAGEVLSAHRLLRRCIEVERVLVAQLTVLETMTPMDFLAFRDHLMPASGFQSMQFREIELVCGVRGTANLQIHGVTPQEDARFRGRLEGPTLPESFYELLRRRGFDLPTAGSEAASRRMEELVRLYQEADRHYDLFLLAESLVDFDEHFLLWRLRHVQMVERTIGTKTGTGGSSGVGYLRTTLDRKFFPELWGLRSHLGAGAGYGQESDS